MDVDLAQPAQVRTGEGYALVATTENTTPNGSSFYSWSMAFNDPYPGGDAHDRNGGEWAVRTDAGIPVDFAFKTFVVPDTTAPRVVSVTPEGGASGVGRDANVTAAFSERMDPDTITGSTFKLYRVNPDRSKTRINASVTLLETPSPGGLKAELDPFGTSTMSLKPGARYRAVVTTGAKDLAATRSTSTRARAANSRRPGPSPPGGRRATGRDRGVPPYFLSDERDDACGAGTRVLWV